MVISSSGWHLLWSTCFTINVWYWHVDPSCKNGSWLSKYKNMKDRGVGKKSALRYHSLPLSIPAPTRMFHTFWIRKRPPRFLTVNPYPWSPTRTFHTFLNRMETFTALPHNQPLPLCELNKLNQVLELDGYPSQPVTPVIVMSNFASTTRDGIYTNGRQAKNCPKRVFQHGFNGLLVLQLPRSDFMHVHAIGNLLSIKFLSLSWTLYNLSDVWRLIFDSMIHTR